MNVSDAGRAKIIEREGVRLRPYLDTKGIPTIGIGCTEYANGRKVAITDPPITRAEVDRLFEATLARFATGVERLLTRVPSQNQFDAMVSLAYNIGLGGFGRSTVLARFNAGDIQGAGAAFDMWHKPPEVIGRRNGERDQFLAVPVAQASRPAPAPAQPARSGGFWNFILSLFGRKA